MRIACLRLPSLALEALLRNRPALRGQPVAVAPDSGEDGTGGPAARLLDACPHARLAGVHPGLGVAAARRLCPDLVLLPRDPALEDRAQADLEAVAARYSIGVQPLEPGQVALEADGVEGLFGGELGFCRQLLAALAGRGLEGRIGLASTLSVARVAACWRDAAPAFPPPRETYRCEEEVTLVRPGAGAAFLAPLPLVLLAPDPEDRDLLVDMGVETCGALARLDPGALRLRLGPAGANLLARARGEDPRPFRAEPGPARLATRLDFDDPLASAQALEAALDHALGQLLPPLVGRGLAAGGCGLTLELETGGVEVRSVRLARSTREAAPLLRLGAHRLRTPPPLAPVTALEVELEPAEEDAVQLGLFLPALPSPRQLSRTISRLEALVGLERIGHPASAEDHRPTAFRREPFRAVRPRAAPAAVPPQGAVRALRPPRRLRVRTRGGHPAEVEEAGVHEGPSIRLSAPAGAAAGARRGARAGAAAGARTAPGAGAAAGARRAPSRLLHHPYAVAERAGPWTISGGWWSPRPWRRHYWQLALEGGPVLRVYRDDEDRSWWADGVVD